MDILQDPNFIDIFDKVINVSNVLFSIAVAIVTAIIFFSAFYFTTQAKLKAHDKRFDDVNERFRDITSTLQALTSAVLSSKGLEKQISDTHSPIALTKYGKEISESIDAEALAVRYLNEIEITDSMNEYQIQEACFSYAQFELLKILPKKERDIIERKAFSEGIPAVAIMHAVGIKLRDLKFAALNIDIQAIDYEKDKAVAG